jgi:purine-binding chemotaxis protein CheW
MIETPMQYVAFFIGSEEYAIPIERVREVTEYLPVTRVPSVPATIRGVLNLRGTAVPVIDLSLKFGGDETVPGPRTCVVFVAIEVDREPIVMGVLTDMVSQVVELTAAAILPPPPFGTRVRVDYLTGMVTTGTKFLLILDVDKVLSSAELVAAVEATEAAEPAAIEDAGEGGAR